MDNDNILLELKDGTKVEGYPAGMDEDDDEGIYITLGFKDGRDCYYESEISKIHTDNGIAEQKPPGFWTIPWFNYKKKEK